MDPRLSTLTKLFFANTKEGERTQVGLVQSIPEFLTPPEPVTYSALDIDDERQVKGRKKAENLEIEFLYTEEQYKKIKDLETDDTEVYWFIQLPDVTAKTAGKPLTWNFKGTCCVGMSEIALDDMLKSKLTIYRNSAIEETEGFPTVAPANLNLENKSNK